MDIKFSIIIPAYKAESYISRCLDSIVNQNYSLQDYEIIVIDDCSPDNQNTVIENFKSKLPNLRLIKHSINKRQGGARNTGISNASGEWIIFMDSDDYWVRKDVLSTFNSLINQYYESDIIESKVYIPTFTTDYSNADTSCNLQPKKTDSKNYYLNEPHTCIWAAAYRKSLIKDIEFRENVFYEDSDWKILTFLSAKKIVLINFPFYGYYFNPCSTTTQKSLRSYEDQILADSISLDIWNKTTLNDELQNIIHKRHINIYYRNILDIRNYSLKDGYILLKKLRKANFNKRLKPFSKFHFKALSFAATHLPLSTVCIIKILTILKRTLKLKLK